MTRKSLALATADDVRSALSAQIPEGRTGTVVDSVAWGFPGIAKFEARNLRRIRTIRQAALVDSIRARSGAV